MAMSILIGIFKILLVTMVSIGKEIMVQNMTNKDTMNAIVDNNDVKSTDTTLSKQF